MRLWVDDDDWSGARTPPGDDWVWAKSSAEAFEHLKTGEVTEISLDHDLGGDDTTRRLVLWMAEHETFPPIVHVHTANIVGRDWLVNMVNRYGPGVTPLR